MNAPLPMCNMKLLKERLGFVRLGHSLCALLGRPRQRFYSWLANWRAAQYVWCTKSDTPESVPKLIVIIYYGWILLALPCPGVTFCCVCFRKMLLYMWKCLIAYSFISCLVINSWFLYFDTTLSIAAHILILLYYMSFSKGDSPLLMIFWSREMEQWVFCTFKSSPTYLLQDPLCTKKMSNLACCHAVGNIVMTLLLWVDFSPIYQPIHQFIHQ